MRRLTAAVLLTLSMLSFCSCGDIKTSAASTQPSMISTSEPAKEPAPSIAPEPTPEIQPIDCYRDILNNWYTAISEQWDIETLMEKDMNYMAGYCYSDNSLERLGYLLHDLDGDGEEELIIGSITGDEYQDKIILELYTISNGVPVRVFSSGERDRYYFCSDGTIANEASGSAFDSSFNYYTFNNGQLQPAGSVVFDMTANKDQPYSFITGDTKVTIDEETANAKITEMQEQYIIPAYIPFSQYQ